MLDTMPARPANIAEKVKEYGQLNQSRFALPQLALAVAEAAAKKEIGPDDAMWLYVEYYQVSTGRRKPDPAEPSVKANASKLRQVIKAADPVFLRHVKKLYEQGYGGGTTRSLYPVMVDACRWINDRGERPSDRTLAMMLNKKRQ